MEEVNVVGYFPFFVQLQDAPGLLVGGGTVALRKAEKLLPYEPRITVVAPEIGPELAALPGLTLAYRPFRPEDVEGMAFVIAASGDRALNHQVAGLCREKGIPVNVVDDKEACSFLFPALVKRGELSVGISTGGSSPAAAVWLKEQIAALLPEGLEDILAWLEGQRPLLKARCPEERARARGFSALFAACLERGRPLTEEEREQCLKEAGVCR